MILSEISIRRPVFTVMVTVALMTLGVLGAQKVGVDLFPDVTIPIVTVTTVYPGASPEEVEQLVSRPIEDQVSAVNGVEEVRSYSRDSVSTVVIQFRLGSDVKMASIDVRDKVGALRASLPKDVREPMIQRVDPTAQPILTFAMSSARDAAETRRLADDVVKPRLEAVDGVAAVNVRGGLEREVHVYPDVARLESLGLTLAGVARQLQAESFDLPAGRVAEPETELTVKTLGRFRSVEEIGDVVLGTGPSGGQIRLADVARIEDGHKEARTRTRLDGRDAVTLEVQKQGGANTVRIADEVYRAVARLERTLPRDVKLHRAIDVSGFIRRNIDAVTEAIVFGGAMAILVIFLFMLDWRSTLISSLALPTSVVTTFFFMWWLGFTFNVMTLLGLSLAIGLLIDDAVVVRENIYRHMEAGEDPVTAARRGTAEIGLAVLATTFTIVAVFVPVAFMGGLVGQFFKQFGLTVTAAVVVSLFVSFTLDPMMSARVVRPIEPGHAEAIKRHRVFGPIARSFDRMDAAYLGLLAWALGHRRTVVGLATALFAVSLAITPLMGKEFMSPEDRGEFRVLLETPAGTSVDETDRVTAQVEQVLRGNPEIRSLFTTVAPNEEANRASIRVTASGRGERRVSQQEIQEELRRQLAKLPGLRVTIADVSMVEALTQDLPVTLYVRGGEYGQLERFARAALDVVKGVKGTRDADLSYRPGRAESTLRVDRARAADLGVGVGDVALTARLALEGDVVAKYRLGDRDVDVRLQLPPGDRTTVARVGDLIVAAAPRSGAAGRPGARRLVHLADVVQIGTSTGPSTIERMNRQRQIVVSANLRGRALGDVVTDIEAGLARSERPAGTSYAFGGQTKNMKDTFADMSVALLVGVIFIYFVLASQFESFIHPLTIMVALPLAIVGALLLLFVAGMPIGMAAMVGVILLMGLVTKNAILLVDHANELRRQGRTAIDAMLEAGPTRLRPILMTSAAMVLGMLPTAIVRSPGSEFRSPMAVAVIGGVVSSTFLTLVVVPVVYTWLDRLTLRARSSARARGLDAPPEAAAADGGIPLSELVHRTQEEER